MDLANAYVISLPSEVDRLAKFTESWAKSAPSLTIKHVDGIRSEKIGLGLTRAYLNALDMAVADKAELAIFFEDDAKMFDDVKYPDDFNEILARWSPDSSVLLFGAHHLEASPPDYVAKLTRVTKAFGTYAWAIRGQDIPTLRDVWARSIAIDKPKYGCDTAWWTLWETRPAAVATPLLVDHPPGVWSEHFGKFMTVDSAYDKWMGHRDWWSFEAMWPNQPPNHN